MIINDYSIKLSSSHELTSYTAKEEKLVKWVGFDEARKNAYQNPVSVSLSESALEKLKKSNFSAEALDGIGTAVDLNLSSNAAVNLIPKGKSSKDLFGIDDLDLNVDQNYLILKLLEEMLYKATGKHIKIQTFNPNDMDNSAAAKNSLSNDIMASITAAAPKAVAGQVQPQGWGFDYTYTESNYESEKMAFSAKAVVKTADGREINIETQLRMSRELVQQTSLNIKAGDALIDPLVINLNGNIAGLSDKKFSFDLDVDGKTEEISSLNSGSGYLALDKNQDGQINDGSELFGPSTGHGFNELASYDNDKNGWIDEKDDVYQKLSIWNVAPDGSKSMLSLKESGVGAIYLGNAATQFSLTGDSNQENGQIKNTSIYLNENGSAGIVHEIDLVV